MILVVRDLLMGDSASRPAVRLELSDDGNGCLDLLFLHGWNDLIEHALVLLVSAAHLDEGVDKHDCVEDAHGVADSPGLDWESPLLVEELHTLRTVVL